MRLSPPFAAYSHSSAVGSWPPIHWQNTTDWCQSTQLIGCCSLPATFQLQEPPVFASVQAPAFTHFAYAATVTSVLPSQNDGTVTSRPGRSSLLQSLS